MFVMRRATRARAYVNACPHIGLTLNISPDRFTTSDTNHIVCANHGALFDFDDGYCVHGPCVDENLQGVPLTIEGDIIYIGDFV